MRKIAGLASASLAALTLFVACSSHDKPTSAPTDGGADGGFPYVNEAVLASNAHAVMTEPTSVAMNTPDAGAPTDAGADAGGDAAADAGNPIDASDPLDANDPAPVGMTVTFPANSETEG